MCTASFNTYDAARNGKRRTWRKFVCKHNITTNALFSTVFCIHIVYFPIQLIKGSSHSHIFFVYQLHFVVISVFQLFPMKIFVSRRIWGKSIKNCCFLLLFLNRLNKLEKFSACKRKKKWKKTYDYDTFQFHTFQKWSKKIVLNFSIFHSLSSFSPYHVHRAHSRETQLKMKVSSKKEEKKRERRRRMRCNKFHCYKIYLS